MNTIHADGVFIFCPTLNYGILAPVHMFFEYLLLFLSSILHIYYFES